MKLSLSIAIAIFIASVPVMGQTVTGAGTVNYVPKFSASSVIASSLIYDNGTNVGTGTTAPSYTLDVNGAIRGNSSVNLDISAHGAGSTVYIRSTYYNRLNNFGALPVVNDIANGASFGYVDNFTAGWTGYSWLNRSRGFAPGSYDVYVRIRTNGAGSHPTTCSFGIYDGTTTLYPILTNLTSLSTAYQEIYAGRFVLTTSMLGNNINTFFSTGGATTNYYLDYVKLVPSPIFTGGNVLIGPVAFGTTSPAKLDVLGNTTTSNTVQFGNFGIQSYSNTNVLISQNMYFDGNTRYRQNGAIAYMQYIDVNIRFVNAASGLAGGLAPLRTTMYIEGGTGNIGIGTLTPTAKLDVNGNIYTNSKILIGTTGLNTGTHSLAVNGSALFTKAVVKLIGAWPDYVLAPDYKLLPLNKLETFVRKNQHLPDVPSVTNVERNGIDLGDTQAILLRKIEELTLYMIQLNKKVEALSSENKSLRKTLTSNK